jgi:putative ABC transport system ATP-binding protein
VTDATAPGRVIEIDEVTKVHGKGEIAVSALGGIGFGVARSEYLAIMGPSGSGKSTLLGILGCLDRPTSGSYRLDGIEVSNVSESTRARIRADKIGFVFQSFNLLPRLSAYRNVELPLVYLGVGRRERRTRAEEALSRVGLSKRLDHHPVELSGGEQQRVAIARALVVEPSVILADEPTGNLDSAHADDVLRILDEANAAGSTIVMVTHALEVAERSTRILRLADGLIASDELLVATAGV